MQFQPVRPRGEGTRVGRANSCGSDQFDGIDGACTTAHSWVKRPTEAAPSFVAVKSWTAAASDCDSPPFNEIELSEMVVVIRWEPVL